MFFMRISHILVHHFFSYQLIKNVINCTEVFTTKNESLVFFFIYKVLACSFDIIDAKGQILIN